MKNSIISLLILILPALAFSQKIPRQILNGQAISDSLKVENITVQNLSTNSSAVTDDKGNFTIYAQPADTLFFSALAFRDVKLVLTEKHFTVEKIIIKMDADVNVMDELVMTNLTGNLAVDAKRVKIKNYTPTFNSGEIIRKMQYEIRALNDADIPNTALPQTESSLQGIDFKKIYKWIAKPKPKRRVPEVKDAAPKAFSSVVREKFADDFFTETLNISHNEILLFLAFCDEGAKTASLLHPQKQLELTDYLLTKSVEYLKKDK